jgi:serine/threonine-protein kinase
VAVASDPSGAAPAVSQNQRVPDLLPGAEIAGCRIEAVAGRGGMGIVYRATQLSLGRPVALKLIAPERAGDAGFRERFERESRLAAAIDHPNVIPVYGAGEEAGHLYLVMRYVAGTDLQALLARERRLEPGRVAAILGQVAAALDAAHAAGLVHRDVKPANVLLGGDHAYLADFGLSRVATTDERMTTTGHWIGTVDFMAPEQFQGDAVDARADVYALGCVLHTALTGETPYPRGTVPATMLAHLSDPPPRPSRTAPGVPDGFDRVVARALAKAPAERYPSAGDLARAARAAADGLPITEAERMVARGAAAPASLGGNGHGARGDGDGAGEAPTAVLWETASDAPTGVLGEAGGAAAGSPARGDGDDPRRAAPAGSRWDGSDDPAPDRGSRRLWSGPRAAAAADAPPAGAGAPRPRTDRAPGETLPLGDGPRRRWRRPLVLGTGLAAAGAAAAVLTAGDGLDAASRPGAPVARGEVAGLARAFASAYGREDAAALQRILSRDAERVLPGDRQRGRAAVMAAYRAQFSGSDTRGFALSGLDADGGAAGRARARYRVTYGSEPDVTGTITFGVRRERGRPRIALVAAIPDA